MKEGKYLCGNIGCNETFTELENNDTSCHHHIAKPIFKEGKKSWGCCKKEALNWEEFDKITPCKIGKHIIKYQ